MNTFESIFLIIDFPFALLMNFKIIYFQSFKETQTEFIYRYSCNQPLIGEN